MRAGGVTSVCNYLRKCKPQTMWTKEENFLFLTDYTNGHGPKHYLSKSYQFTYTLELSYQ